MENVAFLHACKTVSSQSVPAECSDGYGVATGTISLVWTPVLMFCSDLSHASFLLIFYMMGLLSLVMLGCAGWVITGKDKGKNWLENVDRMRYVRRGEQSRPTRVKLGDSCFSTVTS